MLKSSAAVQNQTMKPPSVLLTGFGPLLHSSKGISSPIFLKKRGNGTSGLFHPVGVAPTRSINTIPTRRMSLFSDSDEEEEVDKGSDDDDGVNDDLARQFMESMDVIVENKDLLKTSAGRVEAMGSTSRNYARKTDAGLNVRIEMPGLSKEDVEVTVDRNFLVIKGEKAGTADEKRMKYDEKVKLKTELYKVEEIKAEMKNGVLKMVVPKLKEEERKDIIKVQID